MQDLPVNSAPFQVVAISSSYLPVTLSVQGPATINGRILTLTGPGTVTVTASQAGNSAYAPVQAQISFQATPVVPSLETTPLTLVYGQAFSTFLFAGSATASPIPDYAADTTTMTSQLNTSAINPGAPISYLPTSPVFRYEGTQMGTYRDPRAVGAIGSVGQPAPYGIDYRIDFTCNCQQFELALLATGGTYRFWIDGTYTTTDAIQEVDVDPSVNYILVSFPDKRSREIKITTAGNPGFFGINVANGDTLSPLQTPVGPPVMIFGDSWAAPTIVPPAIPPAQPGVDGSGFPQTLGEYFNWNYWDDGVGGSGFTVSGLDQLGRTFVQRIETDVCPYKFSAIVLEGGGNDGSSPETDIQTGVTEVLNELHTCLPGVPVYMYGPEGVQPVSAQAMAAAVATAAGPVTLTPFGLLNWLYGSPTDPSTGNIYLYLNGHPTPLGNDYLAEQFANDLITRFPAILPVPYALFAPAAVPGNYTSSVPDGALLPVGSNAVTVSFTPQDTVNYTGVEAQTAVNVVKAATTTTLSAEESGSATTLTASVAPQYSGSPGGTVTFLNNGSIVATEPVSQGAAVAHLAPGALPTTGLSLTAQYSGDDNFNPSQTQASTATISLPPDFSFSLAQAQLAVTYGSTATLPFTVTPTGGLTGSLEATCRGLPANATCALAGGPVLLGQQAGTASLLVTVPSQVAARTPVPNVPGLPRTTPIGLALVTGGLLLQRRRRLQTLLLLSLTVAAFACTGCASSTSAPPTPAATDYTVQVTLTTGTGSQAITHVNSFTLIVS